MFQPETKYEFIRRYCPPSQGWVTFVDIDASEEGRTGGARTTSTARARQIQMQRDAEVAVEKLKMLGVTVGGKRDAWFVDHGLPLIRGDRDIVSFHREERRCVVAEIEAISSGQPEQKVYKAVGQIVSATSSTVPAGWAVQFVLVVHGTEMAGHLQQMISLSRLGVSGLALARDIAEDKWLFGQRMDGADVRDSAHAGGESKE